MPIKRYGITRDFLIETAGLHADTVDRLYHALFVYSIGFYELLKKSVKHSPEKLVVTTAIWKVFAILLEYCCKTDY